MTTSNSNNEKDRMFSKQDIRKMCFRSLTGGFSVNWDRLVHKTFTFMIAPFLKKIYADDKDAYIQSLKRNMEFFNITPQFHSFMGGLTINNLIPGPELFTKYGTITYGFILSLFLCNLVFLFLGIYLAPFFARISTAPNSLLIPAIAVLSVVGSFAIRNMMFDVWTMLGFGFLGYFLHRLGFDLGALVLGLILGRITEEGFGGALAISNGSYSIFFTRPLCIALWGCILLLLLPALIRKKRRAV